MKEGRGGLRGGREIVVQDDNMHNQLYFWKRFLTMCGFFFFFDRVR